MKIAVASDHGGYALKEYILGMLAGMGIETMDLGTDSAKSVDYPVFGFRCAETVARGEADRGIVCCGTGIGISIAANKVEGIRCAVCTSTQMAELARKHNDANLLALGGRILETTEALEIVNTWLCTEFEGGRHQRRIDEITAYENDRRAD